MPALNPYCTRRHCKEIEREEMSCKEIEREEVGQTLRQKGGQVRAGNTGVNPGEDKGAGSGASSDQCPAVLLI